METTKEMRIKKWAKVRVNKTEKTYKITKQVFKTKKEGEAKLGLLDRFIIINERGLVEMESIGYTNVDSRAVTAVKEEQIDLTGNREVEKAIEKYARDKARREIKNKTLKTKKEFMKMDKPSKVKEFNYDSLWVKQYKKEDREKKMEMDEYEK